MVMKTETIIIGIKNILSSFDGFLNKWTIPKIIGRGNSPIIDAAAKLSLNIINGIKKLYK